MTSGLSSVTWTERPTGTAIPPCRCPGRTPGRAASRPCCRWRRGTRTATGTGRRWRGSGCPAVALDGVHAVQGLPRDHEQEQDDRGRDERPDDLDEVVAVGLGGQPVVTGLAPVAEDAPDDEPLDDDEDRDREREDDVVQPADLAALRGRGLRRVEGGAPAAQEDGGDERDQDGRRRRRRRGRRAQVASWGYSTSGVLGWGRTLAMPAGRDGPSGGTRMRPVARTGRST